MKKYIALLLLTACLLASCSSAPADETLESNDNVEVNESTQETETETETETDAPAPIEPFEYDVLELDGDPVYEDGVFVLYFTEDDITFDESTEFYIGVVIPGESYTVTATEETAFYPDMLADEQYSEYRGIALRPNEEIPAGNYRFSVTFEQYIVDFELTVE